MHEGREKGRKCESGACVEVTPIETGARLHSTETGTTMQVTTSELADFVARVKRGEFDHMCREVTPAV